jgi:hypothetical protein
MMTYQYVVETLLGSASASVAGRHGQRVLDRHSYRTQLVRIPFGKMALDGPADDPAEQRKDDGRRNAEQDCEARS